MTGTEVYQEMSLFITRALLAFFFFTDVTFVTTLARLLPPPRRLLSDFARIQSRV